MKKLIKKAFTLVELLVVIAILAVLSSVAVIGYNGFTERAEISADQQAIVQMNIAFQADRINNDAPETINEAASVLYANGYTGGFATAHDGYAFVWLKDVNAAALMENEVVVYPEEYEGRVYDENTTFYFPVGLPKAHTPRFGEDELHIDTLMGAFDLLNGGITTDTNELAQFLPLDLDGGMTFFTLDDEESIENCTYKDYYVDFVISTDTACNFKGILWGQFDTFSDQGVAVLVDGLPLEANVQYNVLAPVINSGFTYQDVVLGIKKFNCGIKVSDETKAAYPCMKITLGLYMYEINNGDGTYSDSGEAIQIGRSHEFTII